MSVSFYFTVTFIDALPSYFIKEGRVSECGTHDKLIAMRGDYYMYVQQQGLGKDQVV